MNDIANVNQNSKIPISVLCKNLEMPRATFYRKKNKKNKKVETCQAPANSLPSELRQTIMDLLHSERFVDNTPYEVFYSLLDEGKYYASIRTFYRILAENGETQERRILRNHRDAIKPELIATAPNQVWTWDITKLLSTKRLVYYYLYVILDMFSRYVVGWMLADRECQLLARNLIHKTILRHGIQPNTLTIHSDNGPSMTSYSVAQLLENLGVLKTHSRPYTSNDNPFSESQFKTLKYCPQFPNRFENIEEAERFCQKFFPWYNKDHYHSGIIWLKPESVHYGQADEILKKRHLVLLDAFNNDPTRFNNQMPKIKQLKPVYINQPENILDETTLQDGIIMA